MLKQIRYSVIVSVLLFMSACGGGSGGGSTSTGNSGVATTTNYSALATSAQLNSNLNLATNSAQLSWTDTFPSGTVYNIQSVAGGAATTVASQAATESNNSYTWSQVIASSTTYQVVANVNGQSFNLLAPQGSTTVTATLPTTTPVISLNTSNGGALTGGTLTGVVQLSLNNSFAYPSVAWFCDTNALGTGTGLGNTFSWDTSSTTNGQHVVFAVITLSPGNTLTIRLTVSVTNSNLAVNAAPGGTTGNIPVAVTATSNFAITSVSATLDGKSLGTLATPNACSARCTGANDIYQFMVATTSGAHTVVATATDASGATRTTNLTLNVSNPPLLSVLSPVEGSFINGSANLSISGTASTDRTGAVTVTAFLNALPITLTQPTSANSGFAGTFNLSGLSAGPYTLTISATDTANVTSTAQQSFVIASSSSTTYTPSFSIGAGGQLVTVDNSLPNLVLYKAGDGTYRVRNVSTNSEVTLQGANSIPFAYNWAMDGGYVYLEGGWLGSTTAGYTDCPLDCIYQWSPAGVKANLSNANPNAISANVGGGRAYEQYPKANGGYVIWIDAAGSNAGTYTVYNVANRTYATVSQPIGASYLGNTSYDFAVVNGVIDFFYWANTGGSGTGSTFDVYEWNSSTNASIKLSLGGAKNIYPQTDGQRVAWTQTTGAANSVPATLQLESVNLGPVTTPSTSAMSFRLAGGVLTWVEGATSTNSQGITTTTNAALKASSAGGTVSTITTSPNASILGVGGGHVAYSLQNKVYDWNALSGLSTLLVDTVPAQTLVSGTTVFFTMGTAQQVYALTLH